MRIVKEWNNEGWKFTMFYHNNRYTMKVENGSTEQVYKLGDLTENPSIALEVTTTSTEVIKRIQEIFISQQKLKNDLLTSVSIDDDDEFDDIL